MTFKKNEIFYLIGLLFLLVRNYFWMSDLVDFSSFDFIFLLISYVCFFISIIINNKNVKSLLLYFILLIVGVVSYFKISNTALLTFILTILASKNCNIRNTIKICYNFGLTFVMFHVVYYSIVYTFDKTDLNLFVRVINGISYTRNTFFFKSSNGFGLVVCWLYLMKIYLNYPKVSLINVFFGIALSAFVFGVVNSRTSAFLLLFSTILIFLCLNKKSVIRIKHLKLFFVILNLFLFGVIFYVNTNHLVIKLDEILSARITLAYIINGTYGISLFGSDISMGTPVTLVHGNYISSVTVLDNISYSVLFNLGIISFIIYSCFIFKIIDSVKEDKFLIERILLFIFLLYGISETNIIIPVIGFPLLFLNSAFVSNED